MAEPPLDAWARTVHQVLETPYPYAAAHVSHGADDHDVDPRRLHPAFHGSYDWHSSVHMQWSALVLLSRDGLDPTLAGALTDLLDRRLTRANVDVEVGYLRSRPSYERPYGWAWAALLASRAHTSTHPHAPAWAASLAPLADVVAELLLSWLPRLAYPVRHGVHANTAFALALTHDAYGALNRDDVRSRLTAHAERLYAADRGFSSRGEPSGADFLSRTLTEADLMRRLLPPAEVDAWLAAFLPDLGRPGDPLLAVPEVLDPIDGHAVHLHGLALSRAGQLRRLLPHLPADLRPRVAEAADAQEASALTATTDGDFAATHWLVSFALLAQTA